MSYKTDIVDSVYQMLKHFDMKITKKTVRDWVLTHPNFPSIKAIGDFFVFLGIPNYPVKADLARLIDIDVPFLGFFHKTQQKFVFVTKINPGQNVELYDGAKKYQMSYDEFQNEYSGVSLFIKPDKQVIEDDYKKKKRAIEKLKKKYLFVVASCV